MPLPDPSEQSVKKIRNMVEKFTEKSGSFVHPIEEIAEDVILGLARHADELGKPLCPCRFYPDKNEEVKHRTWICPCDDMQIYKYCHCLLFVDKEGLPITEYLPEGHEALETYGVIKDPEPEKGRPLRDKAAEREQERIDRPS